MSPPPPPRPPSLPASRPPPPPLKGVSAPSSPRGGVGGSRESGPSAAALSLPPSPAPGLLRSLALPGSDLLLPSSPPFRPPPATFKLVPSSSLYSTCGAGPSGGELAGGSAPQSKNWGENLRVPLQAQARMRGGLRKLLIFQPLPDLCDQGGGCTSRDWKIPSLGYPLSNASYIRPGWVTTLASPVGPAFSRPHRPTTQGRKQQPLRAPSTPLQLTGCSAGSSAIWFPPPGWTPPPGTLPRP